MPGLTVMHTLFVREHNRLVDEIRRRRPHLSEEALFQSARRYVGAMLQRITYGDYLPIILGM